MLMIILLLFTLQIQVMEADPDALVEGPPGGYRSVVM